MSKKNYNLHLKGYVGGWDFDADYVDYILGKNADNEVHVLIDSLGGSLAKALSIVAAFRNHGNVHVHYVGMNASAATIASLGAKHVSIDSSAMYLVHKCSMEFFQWASANSDKLQSIIEQAEQMKSDLEKMDANVAQMYASKCKRKPEDLLALMKKGGWLTAKEALDWGFVDEVTDYEDDAAPVITDLIAADMSAAGIPVPSAVVHSESSNSLMARFVESLTNFFKSNNPKSTSDMKPDNNPQAGLQETPAAQQPQVQQTQRVPDSQQDTNAPEATVTAEAHNNAIAAKDAEITRLKAEIDALKKAPGADTTHIVDDKGNGGDGPKDSDPSSPEAFYAARNRAQALYDILPD